MKNIKIVLGIETSCDDTCAAVLKNLSGNASCMSDIISSQDHNILGGIFPELASRKHIELIKPVVSSALHEAGISYEEIDLVAVTTSPGLKGSLLVGEMYAKMLSCIMGKPLIEVNHIEGHILSVKYSCNIDFPYGYMLISGGHSIIGIAQKLGEYIELGRTVDDAAGECFDKVARSIGLPQPWGKNLEVKAKTGVTNVELPMPISQDTSCNMSFSGLKTACIRLANNQNIANLAASFQNTMGLFLKNRLQNAMKICPHIRNWGIVGGVASNQSIRKHLLSADDKQNIYFPPVRMCTDNAVMIGYTGMQRYIFNIS